MVQTKNLRINRYLLPYGGNKILEMKRFMKLSYESVTSWEQN